jgi:hypothetical protein
MTWHPPPKHTGPRPSNTYRGARSNAARSYRALVLRFQRLQAGETRKQADTRRHKAIREARA